MSVNLAVRKAPPAIAGGSVSKLRVLAIGALFLAVYHGMFLPLVREWYEHENFSYGFLIPVISGYLLWQRREVFRTLGRPSRWGLISLGAALGLALVGDAAGEPFLTRVSFVIGIFALVHVFCGWEAARFVAFPLGYLFLMVPPPYPIVKQVSHFLRMFDAGAAEILVRFAGVPVYREDHYLHLPNITLEVADVCSGIASLFAMAALGTLYAYFLPATRTAKLLVLSGALVFPILANLFRIVLIAVTVYHYGPIMLEAFFHKFTGTFTFLLSLGMMGAFGEALRRRLPPAPVAIRDENGAASSDRPEVHKFSGFEAKAAATMLAVALAVSLWTEHQDPGLPEPSLTLLAGSIGAYESTGGFIEEAYSDPKAEQALSRMYHAPRELPVEVFVGYRGRQFGDERLRSPKLVFPPGWEYASMGDINVPASGGESFDAIWLLTRKGEAQKLVIYWYETRGLAFASDLRNRIELITGRILHGRTDGAVVRLATPVAPLESLEAAKNRLVKFAADLKPELAAVLPK